jgi:hypothetical protein
LDAKPDERAKLVLDHAERMNCKRYLSPKDILDGSSNLNLAFVAQIFHERWAIAISSFYFQKVTLCSLLSKTCIIWTKVQNSDSELRHTC